MCNLGKWREATIIALNYKEDTWPLGQVAPYQVSLANFDDNAEAGAYWLPADTSISILSSFITPKRCYKIEDLWDALPAWEQKLAQLVMAQEPISELMKQTALLRLVPHQTELEIISRPDLNSFRATYAFVQKHMEHSRLPALRMMDSHPVPSKLEGTVAQDGIPCAAVPTRLVWACKETPEAIAGMAMLDICRRGGEQYPCGVYMTGNWWWQNPNDSWDSKCQPCLNKIKANDPMAYEKMKAEMGDIPEEQWSKMGTTCC